MSKKVITINLDGYKADLLKIAELIENNNVDGLGWYAISIRDEINLQEQK